MYLSTRFFPTKPRNTLDSGHEMHVTETPSAVARQGSHSNKAATVTKDNHCFTHMLNLTVFSEMLKPKLESSKGYRA